jgi:cytochrome b
MLKIWDVATRIYHWLQALLFFGLIASAYFGVTGMGGLSAKETHTALGTVLVVLLIWRVGWGLFGSETSRFSQFLPSPRELWRYLCGQSQPRAGHNPLGGLMVIVLIASLCLQGSLGIMMSDWIDGKELLGRSLIRTLKDVHEINALLLITLSFMHIIAAIVYRLKGNHLIRAMFTGNIQMPEHMQQPLMASNSRAFIWLVCSGAGIVGIIKLLS